MKLELCVIALAAASTLHAQPNNIYLQHNLISDLHGQGERFDQNLVNPWGISFNATGPFWVSDNHPGRLPVYHGAGEPAPAGNPMIVTGRPPIGGNPHSGTHGSESSGTV